MINPQLCNTAICFVGHSIIKRKQARVSALLSSLLKMLAEVGFRRFICGCWSRFDVITAEAVLPLRKKYPDIKLIMLLPGEGQKQTLKLEEGPVYDYISAHADEIRYIPKGGYGSLNYLRLLAEESAFCVAYVNNPTGMAARVVAYLNNKEVSVYNLAE